MNAMSIGLRAFVLLAFAVFSSGALGSVGYSAFSVDGIFGDHMVLQRCKPIRISGSAAPGLMVAVEIAGRKGSSFAGEDGRWVVELPALEAGGPHRILITSSSGMGRSAITKVRFEDVMVGETWIASGQSNMEFWVLGEDLEKKPFYHLPDGEEAAALKDANLRIFYVPRAVCIDGPCVNPPAGSSWKRADTREANGRCSAVAYWFGKELRRRLGDVPVGIIPCSWGGTRIEPWMPASWFEANGLDDERRRLANALKSPRIAAEIARDRETDLARRKTRLREWMEKFLASDPEATADALANWARPDLDCTLWKHGPRTMMKGMDRPGIAWYRFEVETPETWSGPVIVHFDGVNDCDETFLDGVKVGQTGMDVPEYWKVPRNYRVGELRGGRHVVAVRAQDHYLNGWISPGMYIENAETGERAVFGTGDWCERIEFAADLDKIGERPPDADGNTVEPRFFESTPTTLFNAMVSPVTAMNIAGAIWYQGCSNRREVSRYRILQKGLIESWRRVFRDANLPIIITQLSSFSTQTPEHRLPDDFWKEERNPDVGGFGMFRLMQDEFRAYPNVGVACTIDIGDHSDIHFPNKREVGRRLAHEAMRVAYGDVKCIPGPRAKSARREGGSVIVSFSDCGDGGVWLDDGGTRFNPHLFALAGSDGEYHWADGELLDDGRVRVFSGFVPDPCAVRYCVSDYPPNVRFRRKDDSMPVYPFELRVKSASRD